MICDACAADKHEECNGMAPGLDVEAPTLRECSCLHDPELLQKRTKTNRLLNQAVERFAEGDEAGMLYALRRVLGMHDARPPGRLIRVGERFHLHAVPKEG